MIVKLKKAKSNGHAALMRSTNGDVASIAVNTPRAGSISGEPAAAGRSHKSLSPVPREMQVMGNDGLPRIRCDLIIPAKTNREMEADFLIELTDSIKVHGVIQPIIVRPRPARSAKDVANAGGTTTRVTTYQIIEGEHRWRAAVLAGLELIPCVIRRDLQQSGDLDGYVDRADARAKELQIVANLQRKNLSPLQEARQFRELMDDHDYTADRIAKAASKSRRHIFDRLALLKLPAIAATALAEGIIGASHGKAMMTVKDAQKREELAAWAVNPLIHSRGGCTLEELERRIEDDGESGKGVKGEKSEKGEKGADDARYAPAPQEEEVIAEIRGPSSDENRDPTPLGPKPKPTAAAPPNGEESSPTAADFKSWPPDRVTDPLSTAAEAIAVMIRGDLSRFGKARVPIALATLRARPNPRWMKELADKIDEIINPAIPAAAGMGANP